MKPQTTMGAAFVRAGYNPNQMRLFKPLSEFFANGARDPQMSKMHAHRRAQRYMEKMLLRDLHRAWIGGGRGD